jgi:UDP-2-acetamido-3-amino-2,3-dideoxy-glucuronate N-acetyltransferase
VARSEPANDAPYRLIRDVEFGDGVVVFSFVNLYGCRIGDGSRIGPFVEIQRDAAVGARCKVSSHSFVCTGVVLEDEVFVGHGVVFTNDRHPRATTDEGALKGDADWSLEPTLVRRRASIGSGAVVLAGVTIGEGATVGAGAVVTRDVPAGGVVAGNPAREIARSARR